MLSDHLRSNCWIWKLFSCYIIGFSRIFASFVVMLLFLLLCVKLWCEKINFYDKLGEYFTCYCLHYFSEQKEWLWLCATVGRQYHEYPTRVHGSDQTKLELFIWTRRTYDTNRFIKQWNCLSQNNTRHKGVCTTAAIKNLYYKDLCLAWPGVFILEVALNQSEIVNASLKRVWYNYNYTMIEVDFQIPDQKQGVNEDLICVHLKNKPQAWKCAQTDLSKGWGHFLVVTVSLVSQVLKDMLLILPIYAVRQFGGCWGQIAGKSITRSIWNFFYH